MLNRDQLIALVEEYAVSYGIDPGIAVAQINREGGFRQDVAYGPFVGGDGERGMAQFIPGTWARFGTGNPYNPDDSLHAWGEYMTWLLERYQGNYWKALAAYNGGEGNVDRGTISERARNYANAILPQAWYPGAYTGDPMTDSYLANSTQQSPQPQPKKDSWLLPLAIGAGALLLFMTLND